MSGSEAGDCFRFKPGTGEAAREVGGDGGKVGGRGEARSPIIYICNEDNQRHWGADEAPLDF